MTLRYPFALLLLLPVTAFFIYTLAARNSVGLSPIDRMKRQGRTWRVFFWWLPEFFSFMFFAASIVLIAGPERRLLPDTEERNALSIVLALDRSSSMSAIIPYGNKNITRIEGVKDVTRDFLTQRADDQFALVTFARYPETNTPLTGNKTILQDFLSLIRVPETEDEDGTAIGDAIVLAAAHIGRRDGKPNGIIILLTDGQNNRGENPPLDAAKIAAENGATIYTIGLGGDGYIVQDTPSGPQAVGMPVAIDEETLDGIARLTGGKFYRANALSDLSSFYQDIARRETSKLEQKRNAPMELNLQAGLELLLILLWCAVLSRYFILRRRDS